jgi:hypothetical protein
VTSGNSDNKVTRLDDRRRDVGSVAVPTPTPATTTGRSGRWALLAAVAAPVAAGVALTPWRDRIVPADGALVLVVTIVAVASTGRRLAAVTAALAAALSFDFFLTRPYGSLRITGHADLVTGILLLVVGLAVGELAARGRHHRDHARQGDEQVALVHSVTELTATGRDAATVIATASTELVQLLHLRSCRFSEQPPGPGTARITPRGEVAIGPVTWDTDDLGLPTRALDLPVRSGGWLLGHFVLTPTPGTRIPRQSLLVAVTIADQVGVALAGDRLSPAAPA